MINLLPHSAKQHVRREYYARLAVIASVLLAVTAMIAVALLLPSLFFVQSALEAAAERNTLLAQAIQQREDDASVMALKAANEKLQLLSHTATRSAPHPLVAAVLARSSGSIAISRLSFTGAQEEGNARLVVEGVARERGDLQAFAQALKRDEHFVRADFPVENLARERNVSFTITLSGDF